MDVQAVFLKMLLALSMMVHGLQSQSNLLDVAGMFRKLMHESNKPLSGNIIIRYPPKKRNPRMQKTYPSTKPFMCPLNTTPNNLPRSLSRPKSVHELRPGDIDVIAAMGDSLIAGNGAMEEWALGTMIEYRGISWCVGGEGTWREYLTLPNILKEYNPNLKGFSTGTGEFLSNHAQLNVAFPVSADSDALRQAKILVKRMKEQNVDFVNDWKMITIFFGANDLCSAQCFDKDAASPRQHARKLMLALDYLQEKLPRTYVNLIPVIDATVSVRIKRSLMCHMLHHLFCTCFHQSGNVDEMGIIVNLTREYQYAEELLLNSGRYNLKEDFTVVLQPFMKLFNAPDDPVQRFSEVIDISYITHDCFHFSQKGHALAANMLWNNLLEPIGRKTTTKLSGILNEFKCPTERNPYFYTWKNSKKYYETGYQT